MDNMDRRDFLKALGIGAAITALPAAAKAVDPKPDPVKVVHADPDPQPAMVVCGTSPPPLPIVFDDNHRHSYAKYRSPKNG